jgi:hypothetical protein
MCSRLVLVGYVRFCSLSMRSFVFLLFETSLKHISIPIPCVGFRICPKLRSPSWTKKIYSLTYVCYLCDSIFENTRRYNKHVTCRGIFTNKLY